MINNYKLNVFIKAYIVLLRLINILYAFNSLIIY